MREGEPSWAFLKRVFAAAGLTALVLALLLGLWFVRDVLLLGFAGLLLAIILGDAADWLASHTRLSRGASLGLVLVALLGLAVLGAVLAFPVLQRQAQQILDAVPQAFDRVEALVAETAWLRRAVDEARTRILGLVPGVLSSVVNLALGGVIILVVGIYLAADPGRYRAGLVRLVPPAGRERAGQVLAAMGQALRGFLVGQLVAMVAIGVLTALALWLLGLPNAILLGLLAGLLEFIPYLGPLIAFVPTELVALGESKTLALWVPVVWVLVQQLESQLVIPIVQSRAVALPPAVLVLALLAAGPLFGFLGLLLATPIAAVVTVAVRTLYLGDTLGEGKRPARTSEIVAARR